MRSQNVFFFLSAFSFIALLSSCNGTSKESQVKLPEKATQAVANAFPDGKIVGIEKEEEEGMEVYEVDIKTGDRTIEIDVTADGKILEQEGVEEEKNEKNSGEKHEEESAIIFNFDKDTAGEIPAGWSNQKTGKGGLGNWAIQSDPTAPSPPNVLTQTSSENFGYHFNLAVAEETDFSDLEIELKFKALTGKEDQGGGPVWRYQDADNYYICRANPLESNFRVYKVVNGNRRQMKSATVDIPAKVWHSIKVKNVGDHIQCWYDGKLYLEVTDNTFKSGKVGLWTKADAVTSFDDFTISSEMDED